MYDRETKTYSSSALVVPAVEQLLRGLETALRDCDRHPDDHLVWTLVRDGVHHQTQALRRAPATQSTRTIHAHINTVTSREQDLRVFFENDWQRAVDEPRELLEWPLLLECVEQRRAVLHPYIRTEGALQVSAQYTSCVYTYTKSQCKRTHSSNSSALPGKRALTKVTSSKGRSLSSLPWWSSDVTTACRGSSCYCKQSTRAHC